MQEHHFISDFEYDEDIRGYYLLKEAEVKRDKNGNYFVAGTLLDSSGQIGFRVWEWGSSQRLPENGTIVGIEGFVNVFKDTLQLTVEAFWTDKNACVNNLQDIVPCAPAQYKNAYDEIIKLVETFEDEDYKKLTLHILQSKEKEFRSAPAAKSVHHAFIGGLAMHTLNMMRTADNIAALYEGTINRSLLLAGAALHDIGKLTEFSLSPIGLVSDYSLSGNLLGHLVIGCTIVHRAGATLGIKTEKVLLLEHLLASHHGEPEKGALKPPMCAEAYALSMVDMLDSRMELFRTSFMEMAPGSFARNNYLGGQIYRPREKGLACQ